MEFDPTLDLKHMDQKTLEEKYKQISKKLDLLKESDAILREHRPN